MESGREPARGRTLITNSEQRRLPSRRFPSLCAGKPLSKPHGMSPVFRGDLEPVNGRVCKASPREVSLILILTQIPPWEQDAGTDGPLPCSRSLPASGRLGSVLRLSYGFERQTLTRT